MILVNGVEAEQINVADRGLQYGDGLFETIAVIEGKPEFWGRHMARLQHGCERLSIPAPDASLLLSEAGQLIAAQPSLRTGVSAEVGQPADRSVLKIIVTRGVGGRGYRLPENPEATRILSLSPWPDYPAANSETGVRLHLCKTRLSSNPLLAGIKHLNRLEQVLARNEWSDPDIAEGLMVDGDDHIIEGTMSNIFFVRDDKVITPELSRCGVAGVMREVVIDRLQREGIPVTIRPVALGELGEMEEAFCSNSLIHVWPIRQIGDREFSAPRVMTMHCIQLLNKPS